MEFNTNFIRTLQAGSEENGERHGLMTIYVFHAVCQKQVIIDSVGNVLVTGAYS